MYHIQTYAHTLHSVSCMPTQLRTVAIHIWLHIWLYDYPPPGNDCPQSPKKPETKSTEIKGKKIIINNNIHAKYIQNNIHGTPKRHIQVTYRDTGSTTQSAYIHRLRKWDTYGQIYIYIYIYIHTYIHISTTASIMDISSRILTNINTSKSLYIVPIWKIQVW